MLNDGIDLVVSDEHLSRIGSQLPNSAATGHAYRKFQTLITQPREAFRDRSRHYYLH